MIHACDACVHAWNACLCQAADVQAILIKELYEGEMRDFVQCKECGYTAEYPRKARTARDLRCGIPPNC